MQSKQIKAWALCWPDDDKPMLYLDRDEAEDDLKWFIKNDKNALNAQPPGDPFVVELIGEIKRMSVEP